MGLVSFNGRHIEAQHKAISWSAEHDLGHASWPEAAGAHQESVPHAIEVNQGACKQQELRKYHTAQHTAQCVLT